MTTIERLEYIRELKLLKNIHEVHPNRLLQFDLTEKRLLQFDLTEKITQCKNKRHADFSMSFI